MPCLLIWRPKAMCQSNEGVAGTVRTSAATLEVLLRLFRRPRLSGWVPLKPGDQQSEGCVGSSSIASNLLY